MRVQNLVLDESQISMKLFRILGCPLAIMISERIKQDLELAKVSGLLINPADGWNDGHRF